MNALNDETTDTDGKVSLREAIDLANSPAFSGKDTITFDTVVFNTATTITLDVLLGRYEVTDSVEIKNTAAPVTLDALASQSQIMFINGTGSLDVAITNLGFTNGLITTTAFGDNGARYVSPTRT